MSLFHRNKPLKDEYPKHEHFCKTCQSHLGSASWWENHEICLPCDAEFQTRKRTMTPDDLYTAGYEDGKSGKAMDASWMTDPNYTMGYDDGKGDRAIERPVEEEYKDFNDAPEGFEYTGQKRVPKPYEFYLSKGGKATFLTRERKNNQTRHILKCSKCNHKADSCWHHNIKGRG